MNSNWSYTPETLNSGRNRRFFVPCDFEIWWMTLGNDRAPLLYYIKLCASFQIHRWVETEVTVQKRSIWVKIGNFLSRVTLKFDGCPWKTMGHLSYVASSFVHHFTAISEFKLELQSGNAQSGSNSTIFKATRPWNLTDDLAKQIGHPFYATSSFVHHFIPIGEFKFELQSGNAQFGSKATIVWAVWILRMTLKNNRASLLCYFKLCVSFRMELQSGNAQFGSNSSIFRAVRPWNLMDDLAKQ